ncbi:hypothetical protein OG579_09590 [Williamsia herbipolensis]|uniref:DUF8020 domain-containing protein n=1 Tax=Williamsia herbipolensis TaxID=1603258 RepID=A0AAU4K7A5_9NOCA|nr:hypothetical protein [Williamsia herbipolensis]
MKIRTALVSAAVTVTSVAALTTGAQASAAPAQQIKYSTTVNDSSVLFTTTAGSLRTDKDSLQVVDAAGRVVTSLPLTAHLDNVSVPIKATTAGRTATLTPQIPGRVNANAYFSDPPRTRKQRDDQALATLADNLGVATGVGGLVGSIIGAGLGCVLLAGLPPIPILTGCATGAGVGGTIGSIVTGGPVLIGNINEYVKTIRSPFTPPRATPAPARPNPVPPPTVPRPIR